MNRLTAQNTVLHYEDRLQKVVDKIPLIPLDKNNCDSEEFWYKERDDKTLTYLSDVVKKYADTIAQDKIAGRNLQ